MMTLQQRLFSLQDSKFREFHTSLCPTVNPDTIVGVKTPALRILARELKKSGEAQAFMASLPHGYYEENQIHAFLLSDLPEYDAVLEALDRFLPFVDNWATCDSIRPKAFKKNRDRLLGDVEKWLSSDKPYTLRFGIEMLMVHFLEEDFDSACLERVSRVRSSEYYVNMMVAWFFATALAKQYAAALPYVEENRLDSWVHNKTIQKARESFRISPSRKAYLKTLKR